MAQQTPTRAWVNNPTLEEIDLALAQGAVGSTTNPAYGGNLLRRAPDLVRPVIRQVVSETADDAEAAVLVQQRLVRRVVDCFRPLHEASGGRYGYVSIQGPPDEDTSADRIVAAAHTGHGLGPNAAPKIPATEAGLEAFDAVVEAGYPVIVTEVFSVAQLIETCERFLAVTARTQVVPPFFLSPITGIFGDHLKAIAARDGTPIEAAEAELVGVALSRACHRIVTERGYPVMLLCGGARMPIDLTGLVGAQLHCTINWSTFQQVLDDPAPFAPGYATPIDETVIGRLRRTFSEVDRALREDGLTLEEFEEFGPVQHFRNSFLSGWTAVREAIAAERGALLQAGRSK